ncbi:MAG: haloacid dehalogenase-like hydrolase [Actinomycetes bacterium]
MSADRLLLLWDVDGTLVRGAADAHGRALELATAEAIGLDVPRVQEIDPGGRTDREIIRVLAEHAGVPPEDFARHADPVIARAEALYEETVEADLTHCVLPGVPDALTELSADDRLVMGIVTGNIRRVAELKLGSAGLAHHIDFDCGGYGGEHEDRALLPGLARRRAGAVHSDGSEWERERTVVIGDTPRDIACARADGCLVIGIATGPHPAEALAAADAVAEHAGELVELVSRLASG